MISRSAMGGLWLLVAACAGGMSPSVSGPPPEDGPRRPGPLPEGSGTIDKFMGCPLGDGRVHLASPGPSDMPWRVEIGLPPRGPRGGSRRDGRQAMIEGMQEWERAIEAELRWFELEFVEEDPEAAIRIHWRRRMPGDAAARAGPRCWSDGDRIRAGGVMEVSIQPCPTCSLRTLDELRMLSAHEFGHILGLGHCLECDSAMNYSWHTRDRVFVTRTDVEAVVRRFRLDGEGAPSR